MAGLIKDFFKNVSFELNFRIEFLKNRFLLEIEFFDRKEKLRSCPKIKIS